MRGQAFARTGARLVIVTTMLSVLGLVGWIESIGY